jgi:serine/threonine protein kinase
VTTAQSKSGPRKLGNFEILQEIGQGGMGVIYLARQPALDRLVVLKKVRRDLVTDPSMIERFQREARAAAAVHHQNVVAVYDCFEFRGDHYIAQELVDGADLHALLERVGRLEPRIAGLIALELVRGLEEIHARGIVHRDLKPANILIGCGGETKIADFGIALEGQGPGLTRPGTLVGSVPYMSPEQMLGSPADYRSDLFSFGVLLYEMVTGAPPFQQSSDEATDSLLERIQDGRYAPARKHVPHVPRHLARLIRACLRAKPARRLQSATEARTYLERRLGVASPADCRRNIALYFAQCGVYPATDDRTSPQPTSRGLRRRRIPKYAWLIPAAAAALTIVFGVAGGWRSATDGDRAAPTPESRPGARPATTTAAAVPARPAQVRFVARPWAEIRLEDGTRFHTPRAAPLAMQAGRHTIVFEHPRFGQAEYVVALEPGEERLVRHTFEGVPQP